MISFMDISSNIQVPYTYRARVVDITDGDTVMVDVDLPSRFGDIAPPTDDAGLCDYGFNIWSTPSLSVLWLVNASIRLATINTKELNGPERELAIKAKNRLYELIYGEEIFLETRRAKKAKTKQQTIRDPHGRYIGIIHHKGININQQMLTEGYAEPYNSR